MDLWVGARELYFALRDYRGDRAYEELIVPWLDEGADAFGAQLQPLDTFGRVANRPDRCVYWLAIPYALSRISDVLLLGFQPEPDPAVEAPWAHQLHLSGNTWPAVSLPEYAELFTALGMTEVTDTGFDPFCHEIVEVEQDEDPDTAIVVTGQVWPGFTLGQMLFSRAGVRVRAGINHAQRGVADRSPLYFTFLRRHRPTDDPSLGWGSNSQWDTDFRRDYRTADAVHLNVDAFDAPGIDLDPDDCDDRLEALLTETERRELLRHRCLLRTPEAEDALASADPYWQTNFMPDGWSLTIPIEQH